LGGLGGMGLGAPVGGLCQLMAMARVDGQDGGVEWAGAQARLGSRPEPRGPGHEQARALAGRVGAGRRQVGGWVAASHHWILHWQVPL
jgi:hypothetical protein